MGTVTQPERFQGIAVGSLILGILGAVFFWWAPLGMVFSLTGLFMGLVAWLNAANRPASRPLAIAGTIVSAAALIVGLVVALTGLEIIELMPFR